MEQIVQFSEDRDWDQFHNGKDLALALSIEASELNEAFLWKSAEDVKIDKIKEEQYMTKVNFYDTIDDSLLKFAVIISRHNGKWVFCKHKKRNTWEIPGGHRETGENILETAKRDAEKYPIDKAKGCAKKYSEL